ncbi:recombinase family protein [bacterium]
MHSAEALIVKNIFEDYCKGIYSQIDLVRKYKSKVNITRSKISKMLSNPLYAGLIKHKWFDKYLDCIHKPIISREIFFKAHAILDGKRPTITPKQRNNPDFPLRRFIKCEKCGKPLTASWSKGRSNKYPYYRCSTKGC